MKEHVEFLNKYFSTPYYKNDMLKLCKFTIDFHNTLINCTVKYDLVQKYSPTRAVIQPFGNIIQIWHNILDLDSKQKFTGGYMDNFIKTLSSSNLDFNDKVSYIKTSHEIYGLTGFFSDMNKILHALPDVESFQAQAQNVEFPLDIDITNTANFNRFLFYERLTLTYDRADEFLTQRAPRYNIADTENSPSKTEPSLIQYSGEEFSKIIDSTNQYMQQVCESIERFDRYKRDSASATIVEPLLSNEGSLLFSLESNTGLVRDSFEVALNKQNKLISTDQVDKADSSNFVDNDGVNTQLPTTNEIYTSIVSEGLTIVPSSVEQVQPSVELSYSPSHVEISSPSPFLNTANQRVLDDTNLASTDNLAHLISNLHVPGLTDLEPENLIQNHASKEQTEIQFDLTYDSGSVNNTFVLNELQAVVAISEDSLRMPEEPPYYHSPLSDNSKFLHLDATNQPVLDTTGSNNLTNFVQSADWSAVPPAESTYNDTSVRQLVSSWQSENFIRDVQGEAKTKIRLEPTSVDQQIETPIINSEANTALDISTSKAFLDRDIHMFDTSILSSQVEIANDIQMFDTSILSSQVEIATDIRLPNYYRFPHIVEIVNDIRMFDTFHTLEVSFFL